MSRKKRKKTILTSSSTQKGRGLDVGTAFIYCAQKTVPQVTFRIQRDAFFDIEHSDFTQGMLEKSNIRYILGKDRIYVIGDDAIKFANVFGRSVRRPMKNGVMSPQEEEALPIIKAIIKSVLESPLEKGEICYYSVPGVPVDADFDVIYHQNIIKSFLEEWGYKPKPINEGLAVIFSELAEDDFTGMGISLGGGMANVSLAMMAAPAFSFGVARAGDWIDEQVARATNIPISKVTTLKETSFDLKKSEGNMTKIEQALSIYYTHLIEYILGQVKRKFERNLVPEFERPISIVISGGTAMPSGFLERFKEIFDKTDFPLRVREVRLASHPLYTVAKGSLIAAIADIKRNQ